jgi:hypothetical protein
LWRVVLSLAGRAARSWANGGTATTNAEAGICGTASSEANGGSIEIGDVNSGNNTGNVIEVGL